MNNTPNHHINMAPPTDHWRNWGRMTNINTSCLIYCSINQELQDVEDAYIYFNDQNSWMLAQLHCQSNLTLRRHKNSPKSQLQTRVCHNHCSDTWTITLLCQLTHISKVVKWAQEICFEPHIVLHHCEIYQLMTKHVFISCL